ncbi:uncharacterized protein LOC106771350 isoform X2 [Vigna radiata var. radiata]|uniref:Uncharacterized protein LOC106771350 isoform X2 n=1 Tax=Vigna radiata var. radiata TaxID=3916 RepID=A0A3Q0FA73_VIGRR|nr:uncharacterized protein LOC106771350 isoform X2 [Vigna radiata var. radiata]
MVKGTHCVNRCELGNEDDALVGFMENNGDECKLRMRLRMMVLGVNGVVMVKTKSIKPCVRTQRAAQPLDTPLLPAPAIPTILLCNRATCYLLSLPETKFPLLVISQRM